MNAPERMVIPIARGADSDAVNGFDEVEYVRADLYETLERERDEAFERLNLAGEDWQYVEGLRTKAEVEVEHLQKAIQEIKSGCAPEHHDGLLARDIRTICDRALTKPEGE